MRKTIASNLNLISDADVIEYVDDMENMGINNSKLIKKAIRFYRDYSSKIKQLDEVDIASIIDNDEVKNHLYTMIDELVKVKGSEVVEGKFPYTSEPKKARKKIVKTDVDEQELMNKINSIDAKI